MVAHARKILNPAASYNHHRMLLQIVPFARDVGCYLHAVGETDPRDFAKRRVRLFGRHGFNAHAHSALERRRKKSGTVFPDVKTALKRGRFGLVCGQLSAFSQKLVNRGHEQKDSK